MAIDCVVSSMNPIALDKFAPKRSEARTYDSSLTPVAEYTRSEPAIYLATDLQLSNPFPLGNQSAPMLGLGTFSNASDLSACTEMFELGLDSYGGVYDETRTDPEHDHFMEAVGLTWPSSSTSAAASPPLSRYEEQAAKRELMHHRKARRKRPPTSPRRNSSEVDFKAKAAHSVVERRYRDKLNDKMMLLHRTLFSSELMARTRPTATEAFDLSLPACKMGKAEIMTNAIDYVNQAELQFRHMTHEIEQLQSRVLQLETVVGSGGRSLRSQVLVDC